VLLGTNVVCDGASSIGSHVSIQSNAYIPLNTVIEDYVFLGPCSVITNDKYPIREEKAGLTGATIRKGASIGSNAVILPGVEIGEGAIIGSGAVVTKKRRPMEDSSRQPCKGYKRTSRKINT